MTFYICRLLYQLSWEQQTPKLQGIQTKKKKKKERKKKQPKDTTEDGYHTTGEKNKKRRRRKMNYRNKPQTIKKMHIGHNYW